MSVTTQGSQRTPTTPKNRVTKKTRTKTTKKQGSGVEKRGPPVWGSVLYPFGHPRSGGATRSPQGTRRRRETTKQKKTCKTPKDGQRWGYTSYTRRYTTHVTTHLLKQGPSLVAKKTCRRLAPDSAEKFSGRRLKPVFSKNLCQEELL